MNIKFCRLRDVWGTQVSPTEIMDDVTLSCIYMFIVMNFLGFICFDFDLLDLQGCLFGTMGCSMFHRAFMCLQSGETVNDLGPLLHK